MQDATRPNRETIRTSMNDNGNLRYRRNRRRDGNMPDRPHRTIDATASASSSLSHPRDRRNRPDTTQLVDVNSNHHRGNHARALQRTDWLGDDFYHLQWDHEFYYGETPIEQGGLLDWLSRFLWRLVKFGTLLVFSVLSYACFYQQSMPLLVIVKDLHFDYTANARNQQFQIVPQHQSRSHHAKENLNSFSLFPPYTTTSTAHASSHSLERESFHDQNLRIDVGVVHYPITPTATVDLYATHNNWCAVESAVLPAPQPPRATTRRRRQFLQPMQAYYLDKMCVGFQLAEKEVKMAAALVLKDFDIIDAGEPVKIVDHFVTGPDKVMLRFKKRLTAT